MSVRRCDYVQAGTSCHKPCKWLVSMPDLKVAATCHQHLAATIAAAHEHYRLSSTDPAYTVRRW